MHTLILLIIIGIIGVIIMGIGIKADFESFICAGVVIWVIAALIIVIIGIEMIVYENCEAYFIDTQITVSRLNEESKPLYTEEVERCNQWLESAKKDYLGGGKRWSSIPDSVLLFKPIELYAGGN